MKSVIIIGASGHGKVIADIIRKSGDRVSGFLDDQPDHSAGFLGRPILGDISAYKKYMSGARFIIAIGDPTVRENIANRLEGVSWYTAIHPQAILSGIDVSIDSGTVVMAGAVINSGAHIGRHCIINSGAIVEHDDEIEDYVHISVGASLAGTVHVGKGTWVGIGASVSNNLSICGTCMIGAGAVVVKDIEEPGTYVGVPVRRLSENVKKLCFVTTFSGTLKEFVLEAAQYLHEHGKYDISFICHPNDRFAASLPEYIHYYPVCMRRGGSVSALSAISAIRQILEREHFDLVQYSTPRASLYAAIAAKCADTPVRLYCQWDIAYVGLRGVKRGIFKQKERLICALSTWVEPDSKRYLNLAYKEGLYPKEKGSVIGNGSPSGVDLTRFDCVKKKEYRDKIRELYGIDPGAYVFGFVGKLNRSKLTNELLAAAWQLIEEKPDTYLMLVGNIDNFRGLKKELVNWALHHEHVIITGSTKVVEQYLAAMDCYLLPDPCKGFPIGVIEAEAYSLPAIVSNIPGLAEAMEHKKTGLVVKKTDISALRKAMYYMSNHRNVGEKMGEAGRIIVEECYEQQQLFKLILEDRKKMIKGSGSINE